MVCFYNYQRLSGRRPSERKTHFLFATCVCFCIPVVLLVILYSIILIKLKQQAHPCEQSANIDEQRTRRNKKVHKMAIAINLLFFFLPGTPFMWPSNILFFTGPPVFLYCYGIQYCHLLYGLRKLCYQPDYVPYV